MMRKLISSLVSGSESDSIGMRSKTKISGIITALVVSFVVRGEMLNGEAATYGSRANGAYNEYLISESASNYVKPLSEKAYFPYGGTMSLTTTYGNSVTLSTSISGTASWSVASISATAGVASTVSTSISYSTTFNVPAGKTAQIVGIVPRLAVRVEGWTKEPAKAYSTSITYPGISNSAYITIV